MDEPLMVLRDAIAAATKEWQGYRARLIAMLTELGIQADVEGGLLSNPLVKIIFADGFLKGVAWQRDLGDTPAAAKPKAGDD
jgi:hypothetical protein